MWASIVDYATDALTTYLIQPATAPASTAPSVQPTTVVGGETQQPALKQQVPQLTSLSSVFDLIQVRSAIPVLLTRNQWHWIAVERNVGNRCGFPCSNVDDIYRGGAADRHRRWFRGHEKRQSLLKAADHDADNNSGDEDEDEDIEVIFCSSSCAELHDKVAAACRHPATGSHELYGDPAVVTAVMGLFPQVARNTLMATAPGVDSSLHASNASAGNNNGASRQLSVRERNHPGKPTPRSPSVVDVPAHQHENTMSNLGGAVWLDSDDIVVGNASATVLVPAASQISPLLRQRPLFEACMAVLLSVVGAAARRELQQLKKGSNGCKQQRDCGSRATVPTALWECVVGAAEMLFLDHHAVMAARKVLEAALTAAEDGCDDRAGDDVSSHLSASMRNIPTNSQHGADLRMLIGIVLLHVAAWADGTVDAVLEADVVDEVLRCLIVPRGDMTFLVRLCVE